jgi:nucleotide-binding universal stress UspA family protein
MSDVLIGYEPTDQGRDALALGRIFSEAVGARPLIATALPHLATEAGKKNLETSLKVARARFAPGEAASQAISAQSPAKGLADLAGRMNVALIVVGSRHRGPLGKICLGSTADGLLRCSPVPVAVAPRGFAERPARWMMRLAVAYDGSAESTRALETGIELAGRMHGSVSILHVVEPLPVGFSGVAAVLAVADDNLDEAERGRRLLDHGIGGVPAGVPVEGRLLDGSRSDEIHEAAREFDLLLLGSRGHGPLLRTALGSVSAPIVREAPCPILVLPRGAAVSDLGVPSSAAVMKTSTQT